MTWQSLAARGVLRFLKMIGPVAASNLGGRLARVIGPLLPRSRIADTNLRLALPDLDRGERDRVVASMWESLGRTVGELPHLGQSLEHDEDGPGWSIHGLHHFAPTLAHGGPAILMTAHVSNWEMLPVVAISRGLDFGTFYRPAGNSAVDQVLTGIRSASTGGRIKLFPKGALGARQAIRHLQGGGYLGVLADQKMNDGIEARLFGRPAMTAPAAAALALRFRCPVLPVNVRRTGPARFEVVCEQPLPLPDKGDRTGVLTLTQAMNDRVEAWIRADPASWLWLHRRWAKELYQR